MVSISSQYLAKVLESVGLKLNDKNHDGLVAPTAHWPGWSPSKDDSISYKVQVGLNGWSEQEYRLTDENLSSFENLTAVVRRLSRNEDIYLLGSESWEAGRRKTQA